MTYFDPLTTAAKERIKDRKKEIKIRYEKSKDEKATYYREMDDDQLIDEIARDLPGCSQEMCFACLEHKSMINELRRRLKGEF